MARSGKKPKAKIDMFDLTSKYKVKIAKEKKLQRTKGINVKLVEKRIGEESKMKMIHIDVGMHPSFREE